MVAGHLVFAALVIMNVWGFGKPRTGPTYAVEPKGEARAGARVEEVVVSQRESIGLSWSEIEAAGLMETEPEDELVPRSPQDVAKRVLALFAVVDKAHNQTSEQLQNWVAKHDISNYFSPSEAAFFECSTPSRKQIVSQSWRAEALVPLCWALGLVAELPPLNVQISWSDYPQLWKAVEDPNRFIAEATLRPIDDLDESEQDLYHQHWRVRDAQLWNKPMPEELDPEIVEERRYAASWLMGWGDDWDNVPTDT